MGEAEGVFGMSGGGESGALPPGDFWLSKVQALEFKMFGRLNVMLYCLSVGFSSV